MKKLISLLTVVSLASSICIGTMSVYAEKPEITSGIDIVYDKDSSSDTTRVLKLYYKGCNAVSYAGFTVQINDITATDATYTSAFDSSFGVPTWNKTGLASGSLSMALAIASDNIGESTPDALLGTLTLTVPSDTGEFSVTLVASEICDENFEYPDMTNGYAVTIPAWSTGGGDTKDNFTEVAAEKVGRFDEDKTTVPVDAWKATIDWSQYNAVTALKWVVTNTAGQNGSVATGATTTVSGDVTVTYGLAIAGQATELDTITEVKLVVE